MDRPEVSVIIPAYRAERTLNRALGSILTCGLSPDVVEIVIASDDGHDYRRTLRPGPQRIVAAPIGAVRTGPGEARNRALAVAQGHFIAFLDADDSWEPGFLSALLPLARRQGAAFARTVVLDQDGRELLRLPPQAEDLTLAHLGQTGASYHPLMARRLARPFTRLPAQDVRHAAELLARLGGTAPLGRAFYQLHMSPGSVTADPDFAAKVDAAYVAHVEDILAGAGDIEDRMRPAVAQVFRDKARLNAAYVAAGEEAGSFYHFMAGRLSPEGAAAPRP